MNLIGKKKLVLISMQVSTKFKKIATNIFILIYVGYEEEIEELEKSIEALTKDLSAEYSIGDIVLYCYELNYSINEIHSGNINLKETDPDKNSILIVRENWGEIDQDNPLDYGIKV